MTTLIATGDHVLRKVSGLLPFAWYQDHGPNYKAQDRNDGLIYLAGFSTRYQAEQWARKEGIMSCAPESGETDKQTNLSPQNDKQTEPAEDPQGEL